MVRKNLKFKRSNIIHLPHSEAPDLAACEVPDYMSHSHPEVTDDPATCILCLGAAR